MEQTFPRKMSIKHVFETLGFDKNRAADVRCTLWMPTYETRKRNDDQEDSDYLKHLKIFQLMPYYPDIRIVGEEGLRLNKKRSSGRKMSVAKVIKEDGELKLFGIGLVGKCITDIISGKEKITSTYNFPPEEGDQRKFEQCMVDDLSFEPYAAKRLSKGRKSYLVIPITNREKTIVLGVLFFDSASHNFFDKQKEQEIAKYSPYIAILLTP